MYDNEVPPRGWEQRGKRCQAKKRGKRKKRHNMIAALCQNKLFAPFVLEGNVNTEIYETYVEKILVPMLSPGMVLIIDNARFHKSQKIVDLIIAAQCTIRFLPPYSPNLNPIEHYWAAVKHAIRKVAETMENFHDAVVSVLGNLCTC